MFSFFSPKCPVDQQTADWVHARFIFLIQQFGVETLWDAPAVLPTDAFFPDHYDRSPHAVEQMFARICTYMNADADRFALRFYSEKPADLSPGMSIHSKKGTAGLYSSGDRETIALETSRLDDPTAVIATLAHELAHARLLGENRLTGSEEDHEHLTDLATIFFGLGVFTANSRFRFTQWSREGWSGWGAGRLGYLSQRATSYSLAVWSYLRSEDSPISLAHLAPDPRSLTRQSLRWLVKNPPAGLRRKPRS